MLNKHTLQMTNMPRLPEIPLVSCILLPVPWHTALVRHSETVQSIGKKTKNKNKHWHQHCHWKKTYTSRPLVRTYLNLSFSTAEEHFNRVKVILTWIYCTQTRCEDNLLCRPPSWLSCWHLGRWLTGEQLTHIPSLNQTDDELLSPWGNTCKKTSNL